MLETIFSWLLSAVGEGLQLFVNFFFAMETMGVS